MLIELIPYNVEDVVYSFHSEYSLNIGDYISYISDNGEIHTFRLLNVLYVDHKKLNEQDKRKTAHIGYSVVKALNVRED